MTAIVLHIPSMERDAVFNIRLPSDVKEAVKRAAKADFGRSASSMVVRILREWLSANGYLREITETSKLPKTKERR